MFPPPSLRTATARLAPGDGGGNKRLYENEKCRTFVQYLAETRRRPGSPNLANIGHGGILAGIHAAPPSCLLSTQPIPRLEGANAPLQQIDAAHNLRRHVNIVSFTPATACRDHHRQGVAPPRAGRTPGVPVRDTRRRACRTPSAHSIQPYQSLIGTPVRRTLEDTAWRRRTPGRPTPLEGGSAATKRGQAVPDPRVSA